ncbi:Geranylgeranyl transferase type-1 subunit beta [Mortierella alpina]|nr:Geranylgeranyl transferase type-1 subunit beta [Mortierella alpina]
MLNSQDPTESRPADATQLSDAQPEQPSGPVFEREKHIQYFKRTLQMLPEPYSSMDTHRMSLGMFALGGLELLGVLEEVVSETDRKAWIEWVYSQQRIPAESGDEDEESGMTIDLQTRRGLDTCGQRRLIKYPRCLDPNAALYGFGGGPFSGLAFQKRDHDQDNRGCECGPHTTTYDTSHITMTYTALLILLMLGDDLSRVAKEPILRALRKLQQPNGSFVPCLTDCESDMRFTFCAAAVSYMLNDWSGINQTTMLQYIRDCQTYEHGFSQSPHQEAQGGPSYCAVATLGLLGQEALQDQRTMLRDEVHGEDEEAFERRKARAGFVDKEGARRWCLQRQVTGFQGRINKATDTCYSFWVGGALAVMGSMDLVNYSCNRGYLMETQHKMFGGFGKWVGTYPDVLHSYMGIASLALMDEPGIRPLDPKLNISKRVQERLHTHSVFWRASD